MSEVQLPSDKAASDDVLQTVFDHATIAAVGLPPKKSHALWRSLAKRFPGDARFVVRLVSELLMTESWAEIEQIAKDAARYSSPELDLRLIEVALARGDAIECNRLVDGFVRAHGSRPQLEVRQYELCILQGNFAKAHAIALALAASLPDEVTRATYLADRAKSLGNLKTSWAKTGRADDFDIYVINLDSDVIRFARIAKQLEGTSFLRIPGVRGAYLPDGVLRYLTRDQGNMQKGTVGCFLSHLVAWERVASSGRPGLVLEDDAWLLAGAPPSIACLHLPPSFDLVFANERMSPNKASYPENGLQSLTLGAAVRTKDAEWGAVGTDGYFVSPKGARKLLALADRDGIAGDIDWRLLSYALTERQRAAVIQAKGFAADALKFHQAHRKGSNRIKAFTLSPAIVRQFHGGSVRMWDNKLPHSHLAAVRKVHAKRGTLLP